jgi:hypothetical protein
MSDDQSDRRAGSRQPVYVGVELLTGNGGASSAAITKNASDGGLLLLTRCRIEQDRVELHIIEPGTSKVLSPVSGRVVRRADLTEEERCVWSDKVAIALDQPLGEVYRKLSELSEEQAKIFDMS